MATLLQQFQQQEEAAKAANLKRYSEAMQIYDEIISRYRPGGGFGEAALGQLETQKVRDVGKETQQLISSGLYGTTTMGATGRRWEEAVGAPTRLKLEDIQMQRLSEAQVGKAGFIERREDIGPDYSMIAQLAGQVGQRPAQRAAPTSTYGQYDPNYMQSLFGRSNITGSAFGAVKTTPGTGRRREGPTTGGEDEGEDVIPDFTPATRGQYGTYFGAGAVGGEEGVIPSGEMAYVARKSTQKPYIEGFNYINEFRKRTGQILSSQREAYTALKGAGPQ